MTRSDITSAEASTALEQSPRPPRLDLSLIMPVFVVVSLDAASAAAILAVLPFFLRGLGASPLVFGTVLGAEALSLFIAAPILGQMADRFGRKTILLVSQAGALLSLSLLSFAHSVLVVLLARVLLGLTAANFSAAAAYAADKSSTVNRRQAIGILSAGLGLGGVVGPSLSGYLSDISLTAPVWAALALSATSMTVTGVFIRRDRVAGQLDDKKLDGETVRDKVSFRSIITSPVVRVLIAVLLCHYFAYGLFSSQLPVFLADTFIWNGHAFGTKELGYILAADGVINILAQLFLLGWLGRRISERNLIVLLFTLLATGYIAAGMAHTIATLAFAVLCVSTGVALARPTFLAALSVHVAQQRQGVVMGTMQALVSLTDVVSPVLAGLILGLGFYTSWIGVVVAIALGGAVLARFRLPKTDPELAASPS